MISPEVVQELMTVRQVLHYLPASPSTEKGWTPQEQHLFWVALTKYPQGPWTTIADYIGTKSTRQAMTHAQKLRQKFKRWNKRLRRNPAARAIMDSAMGSSGSELAASDAAVTTEVAVTTDVAVESMHAFPAGQQAKDVVFMDASTTAAGGYYPMGGPGAVSLGDMTVVSESKVEGEHHQYQQQYQHQQQYQQYFAQQQYAHQLGYVLGGYAEHLSSDEHSMPQGYPLAPGSVPYHLPALSTALPPLHPMPASLESVSPRHQPLAPSPHPSPLMTRAMMDDLVHMLIAVDEEEEEEEEEEEDDVGELGEEDE